LKPIDNSSKLNIDVVFINVINGDKLAKEFKKLGVDQVFTYHKSNAKSGVMGSDIQEIMRQFSVLMM